VKINMFSEVHKVIKEKVIYEIFSIALKYYCTY